MSFSDLVTSPPLSELPRTLTALSRNTTALRHTMASLRDAVAAAPAAPDRKPSLGDLQRLRLLRDRNAGLAATASQMARRPDAAAIDPAQRARLSATLEDFFQARLESLSIERQASDLLPADAAAGLVASQPQQKQRQKREHPQSRQPSSTPTPTPIPQPVALRTTARPPAPPPPYHNTPEMENAAALAAETDPLLHPSAGSLRAAYHSSPAPSQQAHQHHQQLVAAAAVDPLLLERRHLVSDIHSSIGDVQSIFVDLASLVGEQRQQVEVYEDHSADAAHRVNAARRQLERADARRATRKTIFFCLLFTVATLISVVLIVLFR